MRKRTNRIKHRFGKQMREICPVDDRQRMHTKHYVWKHDTAISMPNENRAPNKLGSVLASEKDVAIPHKLANNWLAVERKRLVLILAVCTSRNGTELKDSWLRSSSRSRQTFWALSGLDTINAVA